MEAFPIEIKSGKSSKTSGLYFHAALDNIMNAHKEIKNAFVFGICNIQNESGGIINYPVYMIDFLKRD